MAEKEPDKSGLTEDHRKKIGEWVQRLPEPLTCTVCKQQQWTAYEHFVTPLMVKPPEMSVMLGGTIYPHFGLVCTTCGHAVFVNAIVSKIVEPEK